MVNADRRRPLLAMIARDRKSEGCAIVYIGSESDRRRFPEAPDFVDIDLRGKFDPVGLYKLFSLDAVHGIVTFDTFAMHVASAFRKDLYVVIREANKMDSYRRKFIPMYPDADEIVKALM